MAYAVEHRKPRTHVQKVLHVMPKAAIAWLASSFVISIFTATMGANEGVFTIEDVLPSVLLVAGVGFVLGCADEAGIWPIHILLGWLVVPMALATVYALPILRDPYGAWADAVAALVYLLFVTPAAGAVGMIHGVRARGREPITRLLFCLLLLAACCVLASKLSYTRFGRIFVTPEQAIVRPYCPPQQDIEPMGQKPGK